MIAINKSN